MVALSAASVALARPAGAFKPLDDEAKAAVLKQAGSNQSTASLVYS